MKIFTSFIVVILLFSYHVHGDKNFTCEKSLIHKRHDDNLHLSKGGALFFIVSYFILHDFGQRPHAFIEKNILSKENLSKTLNIKILKGNNIIYSYGAATSSSELKIDQMSSFYDKNQSCISLNDLVPVFKSASFNSKKFKYASSLFFGCKVEKKVKDIIKMQKAVLFMGSEADGLNSKNQSLSKILAKKLNMTNLNYDMFIKRGFCICDSIIGYMECDKNTEIESGYIVVAIISLSFMTILIFIVIDALKDSLTFNRSNLVHPIAEPEAQPQPLFELTDFGRAIRTVEVPQRTLEV